MATVTVVIIMTVTSKKKEYKLWNTSIPDELSKLTEHPDWEAFSSAAQRIMIAEASSPPSIVALTLAPSIQSFDRLQPVVFTPTQPGIPANIRVNDPTDDVGFGNNTTQSEPSIAVSGLRVVAGYNDSNPSQSLSGWSYSSNAGQTFTDDGGIPGPSSGDAVLAANNLGTFYYATLGRNSSGFSMIGVAISNNGGQTFGNPVDASGSANGQFHFQDKEWLAVDNTGGANNGNLYLAWTRFFNTSQGAPGPSHAQIMFTRSTDGGSNWSAPLGISSQGPTFGHQGAMPAVAQNGDVYVAWLDRATSQILIARSVDGGQTFTNPVTGAGGAAVTINQIPSPLNGNIRSNSFSSIAVDSNNSNNIYIAYAASDGTDQANVYLVRSTSRGQNWSSPVKVNDDNTNNTDQWMPSVAVTNRVVGVMFYDRRNDSTNNLNIDVYLAMSTDGGQTFLPNKRISTTSFPPAVNFDPRIRTNYMGDYNHMVASGTRFYMVWGDNRDLVGTRNDPNVYFAIVGTDDCFVRDNPADDGSVPSTPGMAWLSPDIRPDMNPSIFGTSNPVHIEVHNSGLLDNANVTVRFYWTDPATNIPRSAWRSDRITVETSPGVFTPTNQQQIVSVPAGGSTEPPKPFIWDPPQPSTATQTGHFCLLAEIESADDPITFTGGGWESIERDNNLAVRNVHVQEISGGEPARMHFFVVGDTEEKWEADLRIDPREVPQGIQVSLTLPIEIVKAAKLEAITKVKETEKIVTLSIIPGKVGRIKGMQLAPKARYPAELLAKVSDTGPKDFKEASLRVTQSINHETTAVGGLMYIFRPKQQN
jgi:hypothetical protein